MGNANVFRQLKERYDRANMLSSPNTPTPATASLTPLWSPPSTPPPTVVAISPFISDSPRTPSSASTLSEHSRSASCNDIASMDTGSVSVEASPVPSPSSSPRPSISTPTASPPATPSSISSLSSSSSITSPPAATAPTSKRSRFSRASLTAAIKQKISRPKKDPLPPWIPTTPELILDEKGLHEVFDRFDADRNGVLCMKEMKALLLQLLEYCIAVEKALLKQATANGDSISMELAQHSLIRLQLTQSTPHLFNDWCRDLHAALDTNKDGRLDRNDFVSSFNRHLQLY